jgi:hypothetical protein
MKTINCLAIISLVASSGALFLYNDLRKLIVISHNESVRHANALNDRLAVLERGHKK